MTPTKLLEQGINKLSVPQRMTYLAEYALTADPATLTKVVRNWATDNPFYQRLAIHLATVARRPDLIEPILDDPVVGPTAIAKLCELGATAAVTAQLAELPQLHRRSFYHGIRRHNLTAVADAIIGPVRTRFGDHEAASLLGACSATEAAKHLADLFPLVADGPSITHLIRRAPNLVGQTLRDFVQPLPIDSAAYQLSSRQYMLVELAGLRPQLVTDLLDRRIGRMNSLRDLRLIIEELARHDAAAAVSLLAQVPAKLDYLVSRSLARTLAGAGLAAEPLRWMWQAGRPDGQAGRRLLRAIPPGQRAAAIGPDLLAAMPSNNPSMIALLTTAERHACAQVWLGRHQGEDPQRRLPWLALLPVADNTEARDLTRHTDANLRRLGYRTLLQAGFGERSAQTIEQVLTSLTRLTNEQDPVRCEVAAALYAGFHSRPVPAAVRGWLDGFATAVRQARDTSAATAGWLQRLAVSALNQLALAKDNAGVTWALDQIDHMLATSEYLQIGRALKAEGLSHAGMTALIPRLENWLTTWPVHRRMWQIQDLHVLRRLEIWDLTSPFLKQQIRLTSNWRGAAVQAYLDDPKHRVERVSEVIGVIPSAAYFWQCANVLATWRTDLLDPYLAATPVSGPLSNENSFFHASAQAVRRWLPRQQQMYVDAVSTRMFARKHLPMTWVNAASLVAAADALANNRLDRYLRKKNIVILEAALQFVPRAWAPELAVRRLLKEADTDRARVAMYSLYPAVKRLPPSRAADLLRPVLTGKQPTKVTSLKAVVHLVEGLPDGASLLAAMLTNQELHRDVQTTLVTTLARHLAEPAAQAAIMALASNDPALGGVLQTPVLELPPTARPVLGQIIVSLLTSDDKYIRADAWGRYPSVALWAPQGNAVIVEQLLRSDWDEWRRCGTLGTVAGQGVTGGVVDACVELARLAEAERDNTPTLQTDQPSLRRLQAILDQWCQAAWQPPTALAALRDICTALNTTPITRLLAVRTLSRAAVSIHPPHVDSALLDTAVQTCDPELTSLIADNLDNWASGCDPDDLLAAAQRYATSPTAGLFVPLVARSGRLAHWTQPWVQVLMQLRHHPDPAVSTAAYYIDTSDI